MVVAGRKSAVYPDGELIVAARANDSGPARLVLEGTYLGKKMAQEFPLETNGSSELAPRGWAEIAVANLLALNEPNLDSLTVALCQQFGIASRLASFLVLENEEDYKRLNLQEERGKVLTGGTDLGQFIETLWRQLGGLASANSRSRTSGMATLFCPAALSALITAGGVPAGATKPRKPPASNPGTPDSAMVGTSGRPSKRFADAMPSAFSFPDLMCGSSAATSANMMFTCPPSRSFTAGAAPL